jgi:hypothetical protein
MKANIICRRKRKVDKPTCGSCAWVRNAGVRLECCCPGSLKKDQHVNTDFYCSKWVRQ